MPTESTLFLAVGALAGLLAGLLGVGGGLVIVPALIFSFSHLGFDPNWIAHLAIGSSLATIVGTGAASTLAHQRRGGVCWDRFRTLAPAIMFGAWFGSVLAGALPAEWLQRLFAAFLILIGVRMFSAASHAIHHAEPSRGANWIGGGAIGLASALVGIGGGTLTVPWLNAQGLNMREAVGTAAACGVPIAVIGSLGFIIHGWGQAGLPASSSGFVYWPAVMLILLTSIPMTTVGARLAHSLPLVALKRVFAGLLLLVAARLAFG